MATIVNRRRGTTAQHAVFTGALGEITIDTDKDVAVIHDGITAGGFPLAGTLYANIFEEPQTVSLPAGTPTAAALSLITDSVDRVIFSQEGYGTLHRQEADINLSGFDITKRGTTGDALGALSSGSGIGGISFRGWDGTALSGTAASIRVFTTGAWTPTNHGTKLFFSTNAAGGVTTQTDATLDSTAFTLFVPLDMGTHLINNVVNPVAAQDAATKSYVDAAVGPYVLKAGDTMTGVLVHPAGSAAAPAISFVTDLDTGIFTSGSNAIDFATAGVARARLSNGIVGDVFLQLAQASAIPNTGLGMGSAIGTMNFWLGRNGTGVAALNNGTTSATVFQIYETVTAGAFTAFSRLSLTTQAGNHLIRTEASSAATLRSLQVGTGPEIGTDIAGSDAIFHGGQGTGTGVGGSYLIQVAPAGSTGAGVNALVTSVSVDSTHLVTTTGRLTLGAALSTKVVAATDAATIATDAALGNHFRVTLGGNRTLGNPTNAYDGARIVYEFIQDGTGSRTITLDTNFAFGTDITAVTLTTTAGKRDFMTVIYNSTTVKWYVVAFIRGF